PQPGSLRQFRDTLVHNRTLPPEAAPLRPSLLPDPELPMKSLSFASAALFALLAPVAAQGSMMPFFPKDTMVAVVAPDLSMSIAEFAKMPLAKMWAEEEVQAFLADVLE